MSATLADRLRQYGLTASEYRALVRRAGGRCEVCRAPFRKDRLGRDGARIDHRHDNGAVRGLVCPTCNRDLVVLDYPASRLRALADYAMRHAGPSAPRVTVR